MTTEAQELHRQQRARDNQAYAIADAIVNGLRRIFFTLPSYLLLLLTPLPWTYALSGAVALSFPLQHWFRRWLEEGE